MRPNPNVELRSRFESSHVMFFDNALAAFFRAAVATRICWRRNREALTVAQN